MVQDRLLEHIDLSVNEAMTVAGENAKVYMAETMVETTTKLEGLAKALDSLVLDAKEEAKARASGVKDEVEVMIAMERMVGKVELESAYKELAMKTEGLVETLSLLSTQVGAMELKVSGLKSEGAERKHVQLVEQRMEAAIKDVKDMEKDVADAMVALDGEIESTSRQWKTEAERLRKDVFWLTERMQEVAPIPQDQMYYDDGNVGNATTTSINNGRTGSGESISITVTDSDGVSNQLPHEPTEGNKPIQSHNNNNTSTSNINNTPSAVNIKPRTGPSVRGPTLPALQSEMDQMKNELYALQARITNGMSSDNSRNGGSSTVGMVNMVSSNDATGLSMKKTVESIQAENVRMRERIDKLGEKVGVVDDETKQLRQHVLMLQMNVNMATQSLIDRLRQLEANPLPTADSTTLQPSRETGGYHASGGNPSISPSVLPSELHSSTESSISRNQFLPSSSLSTQITQTSPSRHGENTQAEAGSEPHSLNPTSPSASTPAKDSYHNTPVADPHSTVGALISTNPPSQSTQLQLSSQATSSSAMSSSMNRGSLFLDRSMERAERRRQQEEEYLREQLRSQDGVQEDRQEGGRENHHAPSRNHEAKEKREAAGILQNNHRGQEYGGEQGQGIGQGEEAPNLDEGVVGVADYSPEGVTDRIPRKGEKKTRRKKKKTKEKSDDSSELTDVTPAIEDQEAGMKQTDDGDNLHYEAER